MLSYATFMSSTNFEGSPTSPKGLQALQAPHSFSKGYIICRNHTIPFTMRYFEVKLQPTC